MCVESKDSDPANYLVHVDNSRDNPFAVDLEGCEERRRYALLDEYVYSNTKLKALYPDLPKKDAFLMAELTEGQT